MRATPHMSNNATVAATGRGGDGRAVKRRRSLKISHEYFSPQNHPTTTTTYSIVLPPSTKKRKYSEPLVLNFHCTSSPPKQPALQPKRNSDDDNWRTSKKPQVTFQLLPTKAPTGTNHSTSNLKRKKVFCHKIAMPPPSNISSEQQSLQKNYHFVVDNDNDEDEDDDNNNQRRHKSSHHGVEQFQRSNAIRSQVVRSRRSNVSGGGEATAVAAVGQQQQPKRHTGQHNVQRARSAAAAASLDNRNKNSIESTDESPSSLLAVQSDLNYCSYYYDSARDNNNNNSNNAANRQRRCTAADYDVVPTTTTLINGGTRRGSTTATPTNNNYQYEHQQQQHRPTTTTTAVVKPDRSPVVSVDGTTSTSRGYHSDATLCDNSNDGGNNNLLQPDECSNIAEQQQQQHRATQYFVQNAQTNGITAQDFAAAVARNTTNENSKQHYYFPNNNNAAAAPPPVVVQQQQNSLHHQNSYRSLYATMPTRLPSGALAHQQWAWPPPHFDPNGNFNGALTAAPSYMTLVQLVPAAALQQQPLQQQRSGRPMTVRELKKLRKKNNKKGDKGDNNLLYSSASFRSDWPLPMYQPNSNVHFQPLQPTEGALPYVIYSPQFASTIAPPPPWYTAAAQPVITGGVDERTTMAERVHPSQSVPMVMKPARMDSVHHHELVNPNGNVFVPVSRKFGYPMPYSSSAMPPPPPTLRKTPHWWRRMCCKGYALVAWLITLVVLIGITVTIMLLVLFA